MRNVSRRTLLGAVGATALGTATGISFAAPKPAYAASSIGGSITRSEVIARATNWYNRRFDSDMTYSMSSYTWDGPHTRMYRRDCSGFVGMAWHLGSDPNTQGLDDATYTYPISRSELRPGDLLDDTVDNDPGYPFHAILFGGWENAAKTRFWYYSFGGTPIDKVTGASFSWATLSGHATSQYKTLRYRKIVDDISLTHSGVGAVVHGTVLRVFARGNDGALWQNYWANGTWTWQDLGGGILNGPSAVMHNGILRVFVRGNDGALWQHYWDGTTWTWQRIGGSITSSPSAVIYNNVLRVFARGSDGALWQYYYTDGVWHTQDLGGGISSSPSAVVHGTVLRVFARANDGALWQNYWANGTWTWQDLGGGISSGPSAVMHGTTLRVFARGNDGSLWQNYWNGTTWTWQEIGGGITSSPSAVMYNNILRVFARGLDGALWQYYYTDGAWDTQDLGGGIS